MIGWVTPEARERATIALVTAIRSLEAGNVDGAHSEAMLSLQQISARIWLQEARRQWNDSLTHALEVEPR